MGLPDYIWDKDALHIKGGVTLYTDHSFSIATMPAGGDEQVSPKTYFSEATYPAIRDWLNKHFPEETTTP